LTRPSTPFLLNWIATTRFRSRERGAVVQAADQIFSTGRICEAHNIGIRELHLVLALSIAKFFDPISFVFALAAIFWLRAWWGVILVGLALACAYQALLGDARPYAFAAACIAMMMQAWLSFWIFRILNIVRVRQ
jgi:hypothetical protein